MWWWQKVVRVFCGCVVSPKQSASLTSTIMLEISLDLVCCIIGIVGTFIWSVFHGRCACMLRLKCCCCSLLWIYTADCKWTSVDDVQRWTPLDDGQTPTEHLGMMVRLPLKHLWMMVRLQVNIYGWCLDSQVSIYGWWLDSKWTSMDDVKTPNEHLWMIDSKWTPMDDV